MPSRLLPNDHVPSHTPLPPPATLVRQKSSFREPYRIKRASSHVWSEGDYTGSHDTALRNGFLRKVFGILLAQVALTAYVSVAMLEAVSRDFEHGEALREAELGRLKKLLASVGGWLVCCKSIARML